MLDNAYLLCGLNALSRAHEFDYFLDGHRGGAMISAVYLCRENDVEEGVPGIFARLIDEHWARTPLCAPFPAEDANPQLIDHLTVCMADHVAGLRQAGHNVILPTLALKAFRDLPEAVTPSRVDGICRMIQSFTVTDVPSSESVDLPSTAEPGRAAEFILAEFVECVARFKGRGQGWSGHLLTFGKALLDLRELGYHDLAAQAEESYKVYIRRIRMGPQQTDRPRPEHAPTDLMPLQKGYWQERAGDMTLGHQLKYPYGFYGLLEHVRDLKLRRACQDVAYRIF